MTLLKNNPIREITNTKQWHDAGFTGKNIVIVLLDGNEGKPRNLQKSYYTDVLGNQTYIGHGANVGQVANEFGFDAQIRMFSTTHYFDEAYEWIKQNIDKIDLINISQVGINGKETPQYLKYEELNIPVICSTGNDDSEEWISYPARYPFTIAVGAYNWKNNKVCDYSNEGNLIDCVSPSEIYIQRDDGYVWSVSGTSFSAPSLCGNLSCYLQWRKDNNLPKLSTEELRTFIHKNCVDIGQLNYDTASGFGLFRLPDLKELNKSIPTPQPQEPTPPSSPSTPSFPTPEVKKYWRCQANAFSQKSNAEAYQEVLKTKGYNSYIVLVNGLYKCQLGAFTIESNARSFSTKLKSEGINNFIVYY